MSEWMKYKPPEPQFLSRNILGFQFSSIWALRKKNTLTRSLLVFLRNSLFSDKVAKPTSWNLTPLTQCELRAVVYAVIVPKHARGKDLFVMDTDCLREGSLFWAGLANTRCGFWVPYSGVLILLQVRHRSRVSWCLLVFEVTPSSLRQILANLAGNIFNSNMIVVWVVI